MPDKPRKMKVCLELHGHYAGKTVKLNGVQFTNGKSTLFGPIAELTGLMTYLERSYQAYPVLEVSNGASDIQTNAGQGGTDPVSCDVSEKVGPASESETGGSGEGHAPSGAKTQPDSSRSGQPTVSEIPPDFSQTSSSQIDPLKLKKVLMHMDPDVDGIWTQVGGMAKIDHVCRVYGSELLTRKDLEAVWPGFSREVLREVQKNEKVNI